MHPPNYHKSEEARSRCYGCSYPEKLEVDAEALAEAQRLIDEGWYQVSASSRGVARLPPGKTGVQTLMDYEAASDYPHPNYAEWAMMLGEAHAGDHVLRSFGVKAARDVGIERLTLSSKVWRAYKRLGGKTYTSAKWEGQPEAALEKWIRARSLGGEDAQEALDLVRKVEEKMRKDAAAHIKTQLQRRTVGEEPSLAGGNDRGRR